jgi:calmodulin
MDDITIKMKEYRDAFDMYDKDRDGYITGKEITNVMKRLYQDATEADINGLVQSIDRDGNGKIDFQEFVLMMCKQGPESEAEEEVINAFRVFDNDNDGVISASELRHYMTSLGDKLTDEEVDHMIREADVDGNGYINYEEFVRIMMIR